MRITIVVCLKFEVFILPTNQKKKGVKDSLLDCL